MKPVVLVAPLDWGLGHATRCIPLIHFLANNGYEVLVAAEGKQKLILAEAFPAVTCINLQGYRLQYGKNGLHTLVKILAQVPKILQAIKHEHRWLTQLLSTRRIAAVISDNRYGLYNADIPCYFITHQLHIHTPFGDLVNRLLQRLHYRFIEKFTACWIPDYAGPVNLAGALSHPRHLPANPVHYVGALSRLQQQVAANNNSLVVLLSGPEPQRTLFEQIVLKQLATYEGRAVVVRGLPDVQESLPAFKNVTIYNHLPAATLNTLISGAHIILSRSGYSTIMDVIPLKKKCIFVPTPGQTEQQYLAAYLAQKNVCVAVSQSRFVLLDAIKEAVHLTPTTDWPPNRLETALTKFTANVSG